MNFGPTPTSSLFVLGFKKRCFQREKLLHEQVPNTNIKFFCPQFKEKMLFREDRRFMNFGRIPTSTSFYILVIGGVVDKLAELKGMVLLLAPSQFSEDYYAKDEDEVGR
jgi:hypothetical protein